MHKSQRSSAAETYEDPRRFHFVGRAIQCGPSVLLPPVCVITGARANIKSVTSTLFYRPAWLVILQPVFWIAYYLLRRSSQSCRVTYFLSKKRILLLRVFAILACIFVFSAVATFYHGITMNRVDITPLPVGLGFLFAAAISYQASRCPLAISSIETTGVFRLAGASTRFHDSIRKLYEQRQRKTRTRRRRGSEPT